MSKENVALFVKAANKKPELNERLAKTESLEDWLNIAKSAGFEFTAEEFRTVVEDTIQKKVTTENVVQEFLNAQQAIGSTELSQNVLESIVGGETRKLIKVPPVFINVLLPPLEPLK